MENNLEVNKKVFSDIGFRMFIVTVVIMGLQLGAKYFMDWRFPDLMENFNIAMVVTLLPLFLVGYPLAFYLMKNSDITKSEAEAREKKKLSVGKIIVLFLMCYGAMIAGNIVGLITTSVLSLVKGASVNNPLVTAVSNGNIIVNAVYAAILAPIFEEILFRKLIIDKTIKYGEKLAIVFSALVFALFHGNFNQLFYAFFVGLFLAGIYVYTNDVKYNIVIHMLVNFVGSVLGGEILKLDQSVPSNLAIIGLFVLCTYAIGITGIILMIVNRKKLLFKDAPEQIEKKDVAKTVYANPGMICYIAALVIFIICQFLFL